MGPYFATEIGERIGCGGVGGLGVPDGIAQVMRERSDGEGELIHGAGIAQHGGDEIAASDIMSQIAEVLLAEWIVTDVLNHATPIGVSMGLFQTRFGGPRVALQKKRPDGIQSRADRSVPHGRTRKAPRPDWAVKCEQEQEPDQTL